MEFTKEELTWIMACLRGTVLARQNLVQEALDQDHICNTLEIEDSKLPHKILEKLTKQLSELDN
jgi:hypothetical protein